MSAPPRKGRSFHLLHPLPTSREALRKLILKATVAGLSALSLSSTAPAHAEAKPDLPVIENRSRRGFAKLVLRMRGPGGRLLASHGSHSSHSSHASHASHASHYSSSRGESASGDSTNAESPARAPRSHPEAASQPGAVERTTRITITGIDTEERKLTGKDATHLEHVFHYGPRVRIRRRGSSIATPLDQLARDPSDPPFKWGSKITVTWTAAGDGTKNAVELSLD